MDEESYDFDEVSVLILTSIDWSNIISNRSIYLKKTYEGLNGFAQSLLHGKGYDRWFDKSFNMIVSKNGRVWIFLKLVSNRIFF